MIKAGTRYIVIVITMLVLAPVCFGQKENKESIVSLTDTIMRNEITTFNAKGTTLKKTVPLLTEIPFHNCTDNMIDFNKRNTYVTIYLKKFDTMAHKLTYQNQPERRLVLIDNNFFWGTNGEVPSTKVDSIFLVIHSHYWIKIPKSALTGIYEPNPCNFASNSKKEKYVSPFYKVLQSKDKRRIYIYMLNGKDENRYEVIWIIQDSKYYGRVVDLLGK